MVGGYLLRMWKSFLMPWQWGVVPSNLRGTKILNLAEVRQYGARGAIHAIKRIAGVWLPKCLQKLHWNKNKGSLISCCCQYFKMSFYALCVFSPWPSQHTLDMQGLLVPHTSLQALQGRHSKYIITIRAERWTVVYDMKHTHTVSSCR